MRLTGAAKKKQDARIVDLLGQGQKVSDVVALTGANERTVYRRQAAMVRAAGDAAVAGLSLGSAQPASGETGGLLMVLEQFKKPYDLDAELAAIEKDMGLPPLNADLDALVSVMGLDTEG